MKPTNRSEVFDVLGELAARYPNWRVGQLLANVAGWADEEVWEIEDAQLLAAAKTHLATCRQDTREMTA